MALLTPDKILTINGVKVSQYFLTDPKNNPNKIALPAKRTKAVIKVTEHNTDDLPNVNDDAEQYTRATVNGNMKTVVPHMYIDDTGAWWILPLEYSNWTCGGGGGSIGNSQTIALEIIMNETPEHDAIARQNAAKITAWLLKQFNLKENDVVSHTYWIHVNSGLTNPFRYPGEIRKYCTYNRYQADPSTGWHKMCPIYILPTWDKFLSEVAGYYRKLTGNTAPVITPEPTKTNNFIAKVICDELNVRDIPGTGSNSKVVAVLHANEAYTIVDTKYVGQVPWGKLKSGIGWISLLDKYITKRAC